MNLFGTILTYPAPSANYRGESEENRTVLQKITLGRFEYAVISPEAIRNALRETLRVLGLPCNRERLHNQEQLAVRFEDYPWPEKYVDDFFFGYLVADRKQIPSSVVKERNFQFKRDSVFRMNLALALEPYRHDALFTQSPLSIKNPKSPWQNATSSALLHRETTVTAFQFPFAINVEDCRLDDPDNGPTYRTWLASLLKALAQLNGVSGNHARSYFEMAPASVVLRLTSSLAAGYDSYGFRPDGTLPEVVDGIREGDYPGGEFLLAGRIVRDIDAETRKCLESKGTRVFRMAEDAMRCVADQLCGAGVVAW